MGFFESSSVIIAICAVIASTISLIRAFTTIFLKKGEAKAYIKIGDISIEIESKDKEKYVEKLQQIIDDEKAGNN